MHNWLSNQDLCYQSAYVAFNQIIIQNIRIIVHKVYKKYFIVDKILKAPMHWNIIWITIKDKKYFLNLILPRKIIDKTLAFFINSKLQINCTNQ